MDSEDRRCAFTSWFLYSLSAYPWEEYFISLCSLSLNVLWRLWQNEGRCGCLKDWLWLDMCVVLATVPWVVWVLFLACMLSCSVVSDSLWPHGLLAHRLLCPWDSPGKNTGVDCHFLLQGIFLTQRLIPRLLHWQVGSLPLGAPGKPRSL